ncbi:MAG: hypothetical protein AB1642_00605 [Pseudomonadota bacterium]
MNDTITADYRHLQQELHRNPDYGIASLEFAPLVAGLIEDARIESLSDYGAGKMNLLKGLQQARSAPREYFPYDPAFPEYGAPQPADLVCCIDVLEHVEPELLGNVIAELASITRHYGFFTIHLGPADKSLADGRNAHLIQQPTSWWLPRLCRYFDILELQMHRTLGAGFWVLVRRAESASPSRPD